MPSRRCSAAAWPAIWRAIRWTKVLIAGRARAWPHATPAPAPAGRRKDRRSPAGRRRCWPPAPVAEGLPGFPAIHAMAPKSTSPLRVPIISPSSGVIPIEVSTLRPLRTAQIEAPLPVGDQPLSCSGNPSSARRAGTHSGARCRGNRSGVPRDSGNTPRQTIEKSFRGQGLVKAGIKDRHLHHLREQPLRRGDAAETGVVMQRGQGRYRRMLLITSSLIMTDSVNRSPPWATRWPIRATLSMRSRWANAPAIACRAPS